MYVQFKINHDLYTTIDAVEKFYAIKKEVIYDASLHILDAAQQSGTVVYEAPRRGGRACVYKITQDRYQVLRRITRQDHRTTSAVFQTAIRAYVRSRTSTLIDHLLDPAGNLLPACQIVDRRCSRFRGWSNLIQSPQHAANLLATSRDRLALSDLRARMLAELIETIPQDPLLAGAAAARVSDRALARRLGVSKQAVTYSLRTLRARGLIAVNPGQTPGYRSSLDLRPTIVWLSDVIDDLHRPVPDRVAHGLSEPPLPSLQQIPLPPVRMRRGSKAERRSFIGFNLTDDVRSALLEISASEGVRLDYLYEQGARTILEIRKAGPVICEQAPTPNSRLTLPVSAELHRRMHEMARADGLRISDMMQTGLRAYVHARSRLSQPLTVND